MEFYNKQEFINLCKKEGIRDTLIIKMYILQTEKDVFNENDLIEIGRLIYMAKKIQIFLN